MRSRSWRATRTVFALILIGSILATAGPTAADEEASHGIRFTDSSGEETPKALGFFVPEGELAAVVAGSVNQSQGGPDLMYFLPGNEYLVWYASGVLWVGSSEAVTGEVQAERQRLAEMGLSLRNVTGWPATLDGQTPQQQSLGVQAAFAQAHGANWPFTWAAQHNEELVRSREQAAAPQPAQPTTGQTRQETRRGRTLSFSAGARVAGFQIRLASGESCQLCWLDSTPEAGFVLDGVIWPWPGELTQLTQWKP